MTRIATTSLGHHVISTETSSAVEISTRVRCRLLRNAVDCVDDYHAVHADRPSGRSPSRSCAASRNFVSTCECRCRRRRKKKDKKTIKVSENDNCHCAGTTKNAVKVMGMNGWRGKPWGDLEKQTYKVRTWHVGAEFSKYGQLRVRQGRPDWQGWTAVYGP